jgi:hypothetical protein
MHVFRGRCHMTTCSIHEPTFKVFVHADVDVYTQNTYDHAIAVNAPKDGCALPKVGGSTNQPVAAGGSYITEPRDGNPPPQGFKLTRVCNGDDELNAEVTSRKLQRFGLKSME